jgi:sigma-B regulation protein RsbQ
MKEVKRDNAVIDYNLSGRGNTTLLFVHGSFIDQTYWEEQVNYFSPHYTVVTFDLPGHGKSGRDRTEWTIGGFAKDVNTLISELNLKNVILIGHSLGGDINLIAATAAPAPITGFIAVDMFKNAATPLPAQYNQQLHSILENLKTNFADTNEQFARKALLTPQTDPAIVGRVVNDYRNGYRPMGIAMMPQVFELFKEEQRLLPLLKFKLYLINVDYMPTNEEPLKKYATSGYEVLHMKGSCHYPMIEKPETFNKLLGNAIEKIQSGS